MSFFRSDGIPRIDSASDPTVSGRGPGPTSGPSSAVAIESIVPLFVCGYLNVRLTKKVSKQAGFNSFYYTF